MRNLSSSRSDLRRWRPQTFDAPVSLACTASEHAQSRESDSASEVHAGVSREECERLWQEGYDAGVAAERDANGAEAERLQASLRSEHEALAATVGQLVGMRDSFLGELEQTLEGVLQALCATVLDTCWVRDDALIRRCVHAALEAFDEVHPSLQIRVPMDDVERVESILADAALALPVVGDASLCAGQLHVDGVARAVVLDLPERFRRALGLLQGEHV